MKKENNKSFGVVSMVMGILSLLCIFMPYIGLPLGILALVFRYKQIQTLATGCATTGYVTGIIGIVINSVMLLILGIVLLVSSAL